MIAQDFKPRSVIKGRVHTIRSKQRIGPMLGFKRFDTAAVTISGTELAARIRKPQFTLGKVPGRPTIVPGIWAAVLAT